MNKKNKNKEIIVAASSFLLGCIFVLCGFFIFSGKKDLSDNVELEFVTFDRGPITKELNTLHEFYSGESGIDPHPQNSSNQADETYEYDPIDDVLEDDSLPSHSFSFETP